MGETSELAMQQPDSMTGTANGLVGWLAAHAALVAKLATLFAVLATLTLGEAYSAAYYRNVVDDALTSMQYTRNLVLGHGLVFNPGERVEGYTNFLWVVVMAPIYVLTQQLGTDFVEGVVHFNVLLSAVNLLLVYALGKRLWGDNVLATVLALGLCVVDNSYTVWAALGLEGHLLAFWMLLALLLSSTRLAWRGVFVGLCLALAHMTRPDAGLFNAVCSAALFTSWLWARLRHLPASEQRDRLRAALAALGTWAVVYGLYFAWRYDYYGWPFPNTYYLKVGVGKLDAWERGFLYVYNFLAERRWVHVVIVLGLFAPCGVIGRALIVYLGLHTLYIAYVGGDFFPGHRFFVPQIPLFAVACGLALSGAAALLKRVSSRARSVASAPRARVWATVIGLGASVPLLYLLFDTGQTYGPLQGEIYQFREDQRGRRDLMRWLALNKTANASLATGGIGAAGFHGEMPRVIDMVGILDPVVAHRPVANFGKGQAGHEKWATLSEILEKKPTYIEMGYLHPDFWGLGYYMDASMRLDLARRVEGVWRRDALLETGRYLQDTAISFQTAPYPEWVASGSAFENWPAEYRTAARGYALGTVASHIDTFEASKGNEATGKLTSAPILLAGDKMVLRVGGTFDPEHLHVSLWVDGQRVFTETGLDSDHLSRREWLIGMYRGKHARLEIVDDSVFGHLIVDEVIQWLPAGS